MKKQYMHIGEIDYTYVYDSEITILEKIQRHKKTLRILAGFLSIIAIWVLFWLLVSIGFITF